MPSLRFFSLLGNKACPTQLIDFEKDENDYKRYRLFNIVLIIIIKKKYICWLKLITVNINFYFRYFVLYYLPEVRFLDSRPVTNEELNIAMTKGEYTKIVRPVSIYFCIYLTRMYTIRIIVKNLI